MDTPDLAEARTFLIANGRLLERRLYEALFEGGDPDGALDALRAYRNADGGFGHGLEADKRVPDSQPLDVEVAFQVMDRLGRADHSLVLGACDFLRHLGPGVGCLTPAFADYPRAPHWEGDWAVAPGLNPTAGIAGLLCKWGIDHPWREEAAAFCWSELEKGLPAEAHGFGEALTFLAWCPERDRAEAMRPAIEAALGSLAMFRLDPSADGYGLGPLHFAPVPDGPWNGLFEPSVIEANLDALAAEQQPDGGWPISWPTIGPAAECDYRGVVTLQALRVLRAYGRLST